MSFMRYIFLILFGTHLFSSVALASDLNSFDTQIAKDIQLTEIDSTEIYQNLIAEENLDANYTPNVVGIVIGSFFTGIGTLWLFNGLQCYFDKYSNPETSGDMDDVLGFISIYFSIPFFSVGIPIFIYNNNKYLSRKNHAEKRDEYIRAYKRYESKKKNKSVQWMIFPSVDFVNSNASLNAVMLF